MSSHELARRLLALPDLPAFTSYDDHEFSGDDSWLPVTEDSPAVQVFKDEERVYIF